MTQRNINSSNANQLLFQRDRTEVYSPHVKFARVSIDLEVMSGTPVFTDKKVLIQNLFDYIEDGDNIEGSIDDFPDGYEVLL